MISANLQHIFALWHGVKSFDQKGATQAATQYLPTLVRLLNQYATGDIPNPVFNQLKDTANRVTELAQKFPARVYAVVRGNHQLSTYDALAMYTNNVPGKLRKAERALKQVAAADDVEATVFYGWLV